jgi:peroxiredoxin
VSRSDGAETRESLLQVPEDLPVPTDDGAADHLPGTAMPIARLRSTDGSALYLSDLPMGRSVVFVYPRTGRPGHRMPTGWDGIPGARGCTTELCSIRDALADLRRAGAVAVYGLSTQDTAYQREAVDRLGLPYPLLADPTRQVGRSLDLPTFTAGGLTVYRRLTMVVQDGVIEHVFYPVFPPGTHVVEVTRWLSSRRW